MLAMGGLLSRYVPSFSYADGEELIFFQIWGFEMVNGERRYTRRVAVAKDGKYELARFVYDFIGPKE